MCADIAIKVLEDTKEFLLENNETIREQNKMLSKRLQDNKEKEQENNKKLEAIEESIHKLKA